MFGEYYWKWKEPPSKSDLRFCLHEMWKVCWDGRKDLEGPKGTDRPQATLSRVVFDQRRGVSNNPFNFPGRRVESTNPWYNNRNRVNTEGASYSVYVRVALLVARDHFPPNMLEIMFNTIGAATRNKRVMREIDTLDTYIRLFDRQPLSGLIITKSFGGEQEEFDPSEELQWYMRNSLIRSQHYVKDKCERKLKRMRRAECVFCSRPFDACRKDRRSGGRKCCKACNHDGDP